MDKNKNKPAILTEEQLTVVETFLNNEHLVRHIESRKSKSVFLDVSNAIVKKFEFEDFALVK